MQAVRFGWDVSADHTVGDRAVREVLDAYEAGLKNQVVKRPDQRLTINHTPMAKIEDIRRMKDLGVMVSIGPWHLYQDGHTKAAVYAYGPDRVHSILPIKSYIKMGLKPALEADTGEYPTFWKMEKAITRKDYQGKIWGPDEKVTRQEALWMSTNWPAYHLGEQKKLGTIEAGKLADLVVIDRDYLTIPEDQISEIKAVMTIVGGKVVYEAEGKLK